jgi:CHAT domain-containing protein
MTRTLFFLICSLFCCLSVAAQTNDTARILLQVDSLLDAANNLSEKKEYEPALQLNEAAEQLVLAHWDKRSAPYASVCAMRGRILAASNRLREAEPWLLEAAALREELLGKEHIDYAFSLNALGNLYRLLGQHAQSEANYLGALTIREKILGNEHDATIGIRFNMAVLYRAMGRYDDAEKNFLIVKNVREKTLGPEHPKYASCINDLALLYIDLGRFETSEALFKKVIAIRSKSPGKTHVTYAETLGGLASLYLTTGQYHLAEPLLIEALAIRELNGGKTHSNYAVGLEALANLYCLMGNYKKAEPYIRESVAIREKKLGKNHPLYARSLNVLADICQSTGRMEEAETLITVVKMIQERTLGAEHPAYGLTLGNLFYFYAKRGDFDLAEKTLLQALQIQEKAHGNQHHYYADGLNDLGLLYYEFGRFSAAEKCFREALTIFENTLGANHFQSINCLNNLANVYLATGNEQAAFKAYDKATRLQKNSLQKAFFHLSEKELGQYVEVMTKNSAYIYSLASTQTGTETAFDNALYLKGFLLEYVQETRQRIQRMPQLDSTFRQLQSLHYRLAAELSKPLSERHNADKLEAKAIELEKTLARSISEVSSERRFADWNALQNALKPGEVAVEFIEFPFCNTRKTDSVVYAALLLKPGLEKPLYIPLMEEKMLQTTLQDIPRQGSAGYDDLYGGDAGRRLYESLWNPLHPHLQGCNTIWYAPAGLLHKINLGALPAAPEKMAGECFNLIRVGSTREVIDKAAQKEEKVATALLYGGIQYNMDTIAYPDIPVLPAGEPDNRRGIPWVAGDSSWRNDHLNQWNYLKWSEKETENIRALLVNAGVATQIRKSWEATEETFKKNGEGAPSPDILHISTHGFFFPDPPQTASMEGVFGFRFNEHPMLRAGLILAGANYAWQQGTALGNREDGILTAYEIAQMDLSHTNLVVLSACETGLGKVARNEGVYGLQRAFKIAGAQNIIMSLWQVPDYQTQEMMTAFYRNLLTQNMPARSALLAAQQEMRQKRYEPYYWAGFILLE